MKKVVLGSMLLILAGCGATIGIPGVSVHIPGPHEVIGHGHESHGDRDAYESKDRDRYESERRGRDKDKDD